MFCVDNCPSGDARRKRGHKKIVLKPWEEIIGTCAAIEQKGTLVNITLEVCRAVTLEVERTLLESLYAPLTLKAYSGKIIGRKISILRTNDPRRPLLIRVIQEAAHRC